MVSGAERYFLERDRGEDYYEVRVWYSRNDKKNQKHRGRGVKRFSKTTSSQILTGDEKRRMLLIKDSCCYVLHNRRQQEDLSSSYFWCVSAKDGNKIWVGGKRNVSDSSFVVRSLVLFPHHHIIRLHDVIIMMIVICLITSSTVTQEKLSGEKHLLLWWCWKLTPLVSSL